MSIEALTALIPKETAHWYAADGTPRYDADLRVARRERLLPSTTSILKLWPKPALAKYLREQDLLAALTLPRLPAETDDAFCARVIEDSGKHAGQAADFGTQIHAIFEAQLNQAIIPAVSPKALEWAPFIQDWVTQNVNNVYWTEKCCVSALGFGCRADALFNDMEQTFICDVKTQGMKNGKPALYQEYAQQLAANRQAANASCKCMSIVFDSLTPSAPVVKIWSEEELDEAWQDFLACFELWKRTRKYNPLSA